MTLTLPVAGGLLLNAVHTDLAIKNSRDLSDFLAENIGPHIFYTPEELHGLVTESLTEEAVMEDGLALPFITLPRLMKPFAAFLTWGEAMELRPGTNPIRAVMFLMLPGKDGALNQIRLARLTRLLRNETLRRQLVMAKNENEIYAAFLAMTQDQAAA